MRRIHVTAGLVVIPLLLAGPPSPGPSGNRPERFAPPSVELQDPDLVIVNATMIDGTDAPAAPRTTLVIRNGRFEAVGRRGDLDISAGARVIDGTGLFVIPGLWDMHTHLWDRDMLAPVYLANGITGVRDMGGALEAWQRWRSEAAAGGPPLPRSVIAGRIIDGLSPVSFFFAHAPRPDSASRILRALADEGADFFKVYDRLSPPVYRAILAEAKRLGKPVAGHVPFGIRASEASTLGQASIEHLSGITLQASDEGAGLRPRIRATLDSARQAQSDVDELRRLLGRVYFLANVAPLASYDHERADSLFRAFRRHGTWQTPTLSVRRDLDGVRVERELAPHLRYFPEWVGSMIRPPAAHAGSSVPLETRLEIVGAMHRRGVRILAGSDAPNPGSVPGFGLHTELELLVEAGLTPLEAIQAATRDATEFLGLQDSLGTLEPGKAADLVLLEADPLADIRNTRRIVAVVSRGRFLSRERLDAMLEGLIAQR